jgi:hypothetical protein
MTSFSFNVYNKGTPDQHILFRPEGGPDVKVPVPNETFPDGIRESFHMQYQILVREGLIEDVSPTFDYPGSDTPT